MEPNTSKRGIKMEEKEIDKLKIPDRTYKKCNNCDKTEFETFIHVNGLCVVCQLIKDERLVKKNAV